MWCTCKEMKNMLEWDEKKNDPSYPSLFSCIININKGPNPFTNHPSSLKCTWHKSNDRHGIDLKATWHTSDSHFYKDPTIGWMPRDVQRMINVLQIWRLIDGHMVHIGRRAWKKYDCSLKVMWRTSNDWRGTDWMAYWRPWRRSDNRCDIDLESCQTPHGSHRTIILAQIWRLVECHVAHIKRWMWCKSNGSLMAM